jgi:hypothetical protein
MVTLVDALLGELADSQKQSEVTVVALVGGNSGYTTVVGPTVDLAQAQQDFASKYSQERSDSRDRDLKINNRGSTIKELWEVKDASRWSTGSPVTIMYIGNAKDLYARKNGMEACYSKPQNAPRTICLQTGKGGERTELAKCMCDEVWFENDYLRATKIPLLVSELRAVWCSGGATQPDPCVPINDEIPAVRSRKCLAVIRDTSFNSVRIRDGSRHCYVFRGRCFLRDQFYPLYNNGLSK